MVETNRKRSKECFSDYVRDNVRYGSLRENFYNFFVAHLGTLPEDPKECKEEIDAAMASYLAYHEEKENGMKKNKELSAAFKREYIAGEAEIRAVIIGLRDIQGRFVDMAVTPEVEMEMGVGVHHSIAILTVTAETLKDAANAIKD